jgi:hypothetical protein
LYKFLATLGLEPVALQNYRAKWLGAVGERVNPFKIIDSDFPRNLNLNVNPSYGSYLKWVNGFLVLKIH